MKIGFSSGHAAFRKLVSGHGGALVAIMTLATLIWAAPADAQSRQPNIVFILADDLGWKDVGFHGSDILTPNLDDLAAAGAEFTQFYAQPMCTPTRAALMTGRYPMRYGLQTGVIPSGGEYGLDTTEWLMPQMLKDAGYDTAIVGKWHLGHADESFWPGNRGFDHAYGPLIGEIDHFDHTSHGIKDWYLNGLPLDETGYDTTLFGDAAVRLIEDHDTTKPLFLYLAFTAPHTPYQAPDAAQARYPGIADANRRAYAGQISAMDDEIGRVIDALGRKGMRDNTLIVFASDNGGTRNALFTGEAAITGDLPPDNGPFRDGKGSVYEGGTRVVALANWPGRIAPRAVDAPMHIVDMYPTFAGLAGAPLVRNKPLDGVNVWGAISAGGTSPRTEVVYNIEPYRAAIRSGDWKLVWTTLLPPSVELFDLATDPSEASNLAAHQPGMVKTLQDRLLALSKEAKPPLFMLEMVRLGLSAAPNFPSMGLQAD